MVEHTVAHVDEAGARLPDGQRLYVVAAVLTAVSTHEHITTTLATMQEAGLPLHYRTERYERRLAVAKTLGEFPLHGAILLTTGCGKADQEHARAQLLRELLPRLEHIEQARQVVLESRGGGDRHDRRTCERLRRSRRITAALRVDHAGKALPLLWPADWVASAYVAAHHHEEWEPWETINNAHLIEITTVDPG
ncbi:hypothetical protein ACFWY9_19545 [Amycolatopsis sp. NPDC059027]|uniref:hypothetical protein n=1 Tax=unclassified Amycolatopsis TaxID=2618356 RepID=UPI00367184E8